MAYATTTQLNTLSKAIEKKTLFTQEDVGLDVENLKMVSDCEKFSFVDLMNVLCFKKTSIEFSCTLSTLDYKIGTTVYGGTTLLANVTRGSSEIAKVEFFVDDVLVSEETTDVASGGSFTYGYGIDITTDKKFKVVATDIDGNETKEEIKVNFYNPYYFGSTTKEIAEITETDISSLTEIISKKENKNLSYTLSDGRVIFAYDKTYGDLKSILDPSSFENISSFTKIEMTIAGVLCYVYILTTKCYCTDFKYSFIF